MDRLSSLLIQSPESVYARCPSSGDTPLIIAARLGYMDAVQLLLKHGADATIQNDAEETALEVASAAMRKDMLSMGLCVVCVSACFTR